MSEPSNAPKFGELTEVELRDAWANEALDFTPWLAENLDQLADVIGIRLDLEGTEIQVGGYSADILARNPMNDSNVIIENQLEWSDHAHIGQILTYLAGLESQTVIWIARGFTEPHVSAIRWLNNHTDEEFAFFAIRLRVVRIVNSPLVPIFEVVEKPNNWERQVRDATWSSGPLAEIARNRREFWTHYSERHPDDGVLPNHGHSNFWIRPDNDGPRISLMLARNAIGIFFTTGHSISAEGVSDWVTRRASIIQNELDTNVNEDHSCYQGAEYDAFNRGNWDEMTDWLHEKLQLYLRVFDAELRN